MISYKKRRRYKYTLHDDCPFPTDIHPARSISTRFIDLDVNGLLTVKKNYAWDGPSGPAPDMRILMRGSLAHDALYQLMREKLLPFTAREKADWLLRDICLEDGAPQFLADFVYISVDLFGESSARPDLLHAP